MSDTPPEHYNVSWEEFHRETRKLARRLLNKNHWDGIIAITRGGMVPATIIARELNIRLVDTLCIASYDHDKQGNISILKRPQGDGEGFLLIDDLVDTGKTAKVARELLPKAYFATVYAKPAGIPTVDAFITEIAQQTWIHFPWDTSLGYSEPLCEDEQIKPGKAL